MNSQSHTMAEVDPNVPVRGMTVLAAAVFIVGEVAGLGFLALPKALNDIGWVGIPVVVLIAVVSTYTGTILGRCWMIMRHRHFQSLNKEIRQPYTSIGQAAFGMHCRRFVCFCVNFTCFAIVVVFLLIIAQNIHELLSEVGVHLPFCLWLVIITAALCPFRWLGTPKDFWQIGLTAAVATTIACLMILVQILLSAPDMPSASYGPIEPNAFFAAFGTIVFCFGGHMSFPTLQVDMLRPEKFGTSLSIAFFGLLLIYLLVMLPAFIVYGDNIDPNVLLNITPGPLLIAAQVLITLHLPAGVIIIINPVCQEGEELLSIPPCYCWQRVVFRTCVMALVLFTAMTLPKFGFILSLVGGSTMTFTSFIFPPLFYLRLCSMKGDWDHVEVPLHEKVACVEIILAGVLVGGAATYSAIMDLLFDSNMCKPCYA